MGGHPSLVGPLARRIHDAELLDGADHDPGELAESLRMVAQVNRWLAGSRSLRRALGEHLREGVPLRLLDVGTGNGESALQLRRWARDRGAHWTFVGLDLHPQIAVLARSSAPSCEPLAVVRGNALRLPFADRSFDVAFSSLTLHHFDDQQAVVAIREMARVSRLGVAVSDLERSALGLAGARLLASTVWRRNRLTRNDGPLSVRRSFTASELAGVGAEAGLRTPRVQRFFPCRLLLMGESGPEP